MFKWIFFALKFAQRLSLHLVQQIVLVATWTEFPTASVAFVYAALVHHNLRLGKIKSILRPASPFIQLGKVRVDSSSLWDGGSRLNQVNSLSANFWLSVLFKIYVPGTCKGPRDRNVVKISSILTNTQTSSHRIKSVKNVHTCTTSWHQLLALMRFFLALMSNTLQPW